MEAILAKILASKVLTSGIGFVSGFLAARVIPQLVKKQVGDLLVKALEPKVSDPFVKERLHNMAKEAILLVEYLVPESGLGPKRKEALKVYLDKLGILGKLVYDLIDPIVATLDKELQDVAKKAQQS